MKVYVVTHKPFFEPIPKGYEYIQVNAAQEAHFCPLTDDRGDNISAKNPFYCELTAAYWIWKNDHENRSVGLVHYRRFLTRNRFSSSYRNYLSAEKADRLLQKYDFIATKLYRTKETVEEHLCQSVKRRDFLLLKETAAEVCPEYLPAFEEVFSGHESYLLNLFFADKKTWDAYYSWLFALLGALEKKVDMTGYSKEEQRLYGFLGERLFTVYVKKNRCRVKSYPTHLVGVPKRKIIQDKILKLFGFKR